jgi:hypothetical protein
MSHGRGSIAQSQLAYNSATWLLLLLIRLMSMSQCFSGDVIMPTMAISLVCQALFLFVVPLVWTS